MVAILAVALSNPTGAIGAAGGKIRNLLPEGSKQWLEEFLSSKRKPVAKEKTGSPFVPTKPEILAYAVSLAVLTIGFSYVKVPDITMILAVLPTILATAVVVEVLRKYILEVFARTRGIWTEHRIWYTGLALFLITTFTLGVPFSSPSRNIYHSPKMTKRLSALISIVAILVTMAFAVLFFGLLLGGFAVIGGTGLAMCLIMNLVDTLPLEPMNGKAIFNYKKSLWGVIFSVELIMYLAWLIFL